MPCVIEAHGHSYLIEDPGGLIGRPIRQGTPYERRVLEHIYRKQLRGLAVDVGASVGNHSLWLAAVCGLKVLAIEPLDHVRLRHNIALNDLSERITVWPVGLGARVGRSAVVGLRGESPPVPIVPLDDFNLEDIALMKIDVEGMEPQVLRGAEQTIRREQPVIYAEAIDDAAHERNAEILTSLGYEHLKTFGATPLEEWKPC